LPTKGLATVLAARARLSKGGGGEEKVEGLVG
jgi:hypothetical protein